MSWGGGPPKPGLVLQAICGEGTCIHCLNPKGSELHRELCEVNSQ